MLFFAAANPSLKESSESRCPMLHRLRIMRHGAVRQLMRSHVHFVRLRPIYLLMHDPSVVRRSHICTRRQRA